MWRLEHARASLDIPPMRFKIQLDHPEAGFGPVQLQGQTLREAAFLRIHELDWDATDQQTRQQHHIRGSDLVTSYRMSDSHEISTEIYWRAICDEQSAATGVELIVSVQTSSLDSHPQMMIGSRIPATELYQIVEPEAPTTRLIRSDTSPELVPTGRGGAGALLYRLRDAPFSYLEMIHPADCSQLDISCDSSKPSQFTSSFRLFDEPLEKGVIRRGRLRGLFLRREKDETSAVDCYRQFVDSAIPLTV